MIFTTPVLLHRHILMKKVNIRMSEIIPISLEEAQSQAAWLLTYLLKLHKLEFVGCAIICVSEAVLT